MNPCDHLLFLFLKFILMHTLIFLLFGIAYYLITFADSYLAIYPTTNKVVEGVRFVLTSS